MYQKILVCGNSFIENEFLIQNRTNNGHERHEINCMQLVAAAYRPLHFLCKGANLDLSSVVFENNLIACTARHLTDRTPWRLWGAWP
jgi:hypothetical protein